MSSMIVLISIIGIPALFYLTVYLFNKKNITFINKQNAVDQNFLKVALLITDKSILILIVVSTLFHVFQYSKDPFYFQDIVFLYLLAYPFLIAGLYLFGLGMAIFLSQIFVPFYVDKNNNSRRIFSYNGINRLAAIGLLIVGIVMGISWFIQNKNLIMPNEKIIYEYYEDGKKMYERHYVNGKQNGYTWAFEKNGTKAERHLYEDDVLKERVALYPSGAMWAKIIYENGLAVKRIDYLEDGTIAGTEDYPVQ